MLRARREQERHCPEDARKIREFAHAPYRQHMMIAVVAIPENWDECQSVSQRDVEKIQV